MRTGLIFIDNIISTEKNIMRTGLRSSEAFVTNKSFVSSVGGRITRVRKSIVIRKKMFYKEL